MARQRDGDLTGINAALRRCGGREGSTSSELASAVESFLTANSDPAASPNLRRDEPDDMVLVYNAVAAMAGRQDKSAPLLAPLLTAVKYLMRKPANRRTTGPSCATTLVAVLRSEPLSVDCGCEAANAVLNLCYEASNAALFCSHGGLEAVLRLLQPSASPAVQVTGLGALQSLCFHVPGRERARILGAVDLVVPLLLSPCEVVRTRALGCLHNMSADPKSICLIRQAGAVPALLAMLRSPCPEACAAAAGAMQNVSREAASRELLLECGSVAPLCDLLVGTDMSAAVSAAGALLNILGPEVGSDGDGSGGGARALLRECLSDGLALAALRSCLT